MSFNGYTKYPAELVKQIEGLRLQGLKNQPIADRLGVSLNTVAFLVTKHKMGRGNTWSPESVQALVYWHRQGLTVAEICEKFKLGSVQGAGRIIRLNKALVLPEGYLPPEKIDQSHTEAKILEGPVPDQNLSTIPEALEKEIIRLKVDDFMSLEQISAKVGVPVGTVSVILWRNEAKLPINAYRDKIGRSYTEEQEEAAIALRTKENPLTSREISHLLKVPMSVLKDIFIKNDIVLSDEDRAAHSVMSGPQKEIRAFVEGLLGYQVRFDDRTVIKPKELDIYIPDLKVAIEYCGLWWHRFEEKGARAHLEKLQACEAQGIRLLTLFEDEWLSKQPLVEGKIRSVLGLDKEKLGARQTTPGKVPRSEALKFLTRYHIQGPAMKDSVFYGLYRGEELVTVASFRPSSPSRIGPSAPGYWELSRFCSNIRVQGGLSKVLSEFRKSESVTSLVSFSDKRWSEGGMYKAAGFVKTGSTDPNYWYFRQGFCKDRYHKSLFRKEKIQKKFPEVYSKEKTEFEMMAEAKYHRIYDCGLDRWEMTFQEKPITQ